MDFFLPVDICRMTVSECYNGSDSNRNVLLCYVMVVLFHVLMCDMGILCLFVICEARDILVFVSNLTLALNMRF